MATEDGSLRYLASAERGGGDFSKDKQSGTEIRHNRTQDIFSSINKLCFNPSGFLRKYSSLSFYI